MQIFLKESAYAVVTVCTHNLFKKFKIEQKSSSPIV